MIPPQAGMRYSYFTLDAIGDGRNVTHMNSAQRARLEQITVLSLPIRLSDSVPRR
jgi:hypothetical protein